MLQNPLTYVLGQLDSKPQSSAKIVVMSKDLQPIEEFEGIRRVWVEDAQEYWFAVVDVIELLTESNNPGRYWRDMKYREPEQELNANCVEFPMKHKKNNRTYQTECANQEGMLRIIQSIPSPKAEPFKLWLAKTGSRRLDEIRNDPIELEREKYRLMGYDEEWIAARIGSITTRNELTDKWRKRGVKEGLEYGILTNEIHKGTFDGLGVKDHKNLKGVKKGNLRDHMTPLELAFTILGEASTSENIRKNDAIGFEANKAAARKGGHDAGIARKAFEESSGQKVISNKSYLAEVKKRKELEDNDQESAG